MVDLALLKSIFFSTSLIMYRKNSNMTVKETQLQEAIIVVLNNEHICHSISIVFNVPY